MTKSLCLLLGLLVAAFAVAPAEGAEFHAATPELVALGAASYWTESNGPHSRVTVVDHAGTVLKIVDLDMTDPHSVEASVAMPDAQLPEIAFRWDQVHGTLQVWEGGSLTPAEAVYDFQTGKWNNDPNLASLGQEHYQSLGLAALVLDAVQREARPAAREEVEPSCSPQSALPGDEVSGLIYCDGSRCRGFGTGAGASLCCEEAWQDASNCCTNGVCWGCCRFLACDRGCAIGDYICFCGVTGISCSYPDY